MKIQFDAAEILRMAREFHGGSGTYGLGFAIKDQREGEKLATPLYWITCTHPHHATQDKEWMGLSYPHCLAMIKKEGAK